MAVYQLLVTMLSPAVAYALAWLVGLVIVAVAYPKVVFRVTGGWARGGAIAITYAVVFAVGLLLIKLLNSVTIHSRLSILLVLAVTTTMSYFASRLAIARTNRQKGVCPLGPGESKA
jgi:FtsH-binding integral membrane protein